METQKIEILDAEVIESNPLPVVHPLEAGLMIGSFFLGYMIGRSGTKKAVAKRKTLKGGK